ncbi:choice-of-anchor Q domain-containing protein [Jiulongibacter sediminis]|uniref:choice-of-anchor Q domain-containing protein n=1 Tax=Jiulongibacter sediminis TaxID=1605367 RepID=UPI0026ED0E4D|nr:choice-of-anchor Q domain-containing protein [Jiulongibacter sediminis]
MKKNLLLLFTIELFSMSVLGVGSPPAAFVKWNATGNGTGTDWANAYTNLSDALNNGFTTIYVAKGTYYPQDSLGQAPVDPRNKTFKIDAFTQIYGGFKGDEVLIGFDMSTRDFIANETILSGDIDMNDPDISGNTYHVVTTENVLSFNVFDGFTITGGNADLLTVYNYGGGGWLNIASSGNVSSPVIRNCTFLKNNATRGGGIFNNGNQSTAEPQIINCRFIENTASTAGGAFYFFGDGGSVKDRVENVVFYQNGNSHVGYDDGNLGGEPEFINCAFNGATACVIDVNYWDSGTGPVSFENCIFWGNNGDILNSTNGVDVSTNAQVSIQNSIVEEAVFDGLNANFMQDPLFLNTPDDYLLLKPSSPAIDAASSAGTASFDLLGNPRVFGQKDLGPYEYQGKLFVNTNATGRGNGYTWKDAFSNLSAALSYGGVKTEFWVAAGTYLPSGSISSSFSVPDSAKLYGGFTGSETTLNQRDWRKNKTILDGENNFYHIVKFYNSSPETLIDGFVIQGGAATFDGGVSIVSESYGGGILIEAGSSGSSSPLIENCVIQHNEAREGGGGIGSFTNGFGKTAAVIRNTVVKENKVMNGRGAGIFLDDLDPNGVTKIENTEVSNNIAFGFAAYGGGIYLKLESGTLSVPITNCSIVSNFSRDGGGLYAFQTGGSLQVNVTNTLIFGNKGFINDPDVIENSVKFDGPAATFNSSLIQYRLITSNDNLSGDIDPRIIKSIVPNADTTNYVDARLTRCSPLINEGTSTGVPLTDLFGNTRVGNPDIGAYEFGSASGARIYVKQHSTGGDGTSWAKAFGNLQSAIFASNACLSSDSIWVAAGTYYPTETDKRWLSFKLDTNTYIFGGFAGNEPSNYNLALRDFVQNETIISGDIGVVGDSTDNVSTIFELGEEEQTSLLDGLTITGAQANLSSPGGFKYTSGGAVISRAVDGDHHLTIRNSVLKNNYAESNGAGIFSQGFNGHTAILNLENCNFYGNKASFSGSCVENDASNGGEAICNAINSTFRGSDGNAIRNIAYSSSVSILNCEGCVFSGNEIGSRAAGISNYDADGTAKTSIINSTFTGNKAFQGSALYNRGGELFVTNSIFWKNDHFGPLDDILTENGGNTTVKYSMREGSTDNANGNIPATDPLFVAGIDPLTSPNNGGDFRLKNCSPVADKGLNDSVSVAFDLAGNSRIFNDTGLPTAIVDLGAYEHQGFYLPETASVAYQIDTADPTFTEIEANTVTGSALIVDPSKVLFRAGKSISLSPGFEAENGAVFRAEIRVGCP